MNNLYRIAMCLLLALGWWALPCFASSKRIDISTLGAVPNNPAYAAANATALQNAIDRNPGCETYLPAGTWYINKPIFMDQANMSIAGAGMGTSILKAAPGYKGITMLYQSWYIETPDNEVTPSDRPTCTYDGSVTGTRYGLRSYTEYPDLGTYHYGANDRGGWSSGTGYAAGDVVQCGTGVQPWVNKFYVCIQAHTADATNQPNAGANWTTYWVRRKVTAAQFYGTPFGGGAIVNAATGEVSRWHGMDNFTIDVFIKNNKNAVHNSYILGGPTSTVNGKQLFYINCNYYGQLQYACTLDDGSSIGGTTSQTINANTAYRISLQMKKFGDGTRMLALWATDPASGLVKLLRTDTLPAGRTLAPAEWGALEFGTGHWADTYALYEIQVTDLTLMGQHLSSDARYYLPASPVIGSTQTLDGTTQPTDSFRYFDNSANTVAFLPMQDNPQDSVPHTESNLYRYGGIITVQHGAAAGDASQQSYGCWRNFLGLGGIGTQEIHDLTIQNADATEFYPWGTGMATGYLLGFNMYNTDIRGGCYGIGSMNVGCNAYYGYLENVTLHGCEAGYFAVYEEFSGRNITFPTPGRTAILTIDGTPMFKNVTIGNGTYTGPYTDHLVRSYVTASYGGGEQYFEYITCNNPGMSWPRDSAFYVGTCGDTFVVTDCSVNTLPAAASFLTVPQWGVHPRSSFLVQNCTVSQASGGATFADFVRTSDPYAYGRVYNCNATIPVQTWLNAQAGSDNNNTYTYHADLTSVPTATNNWTKEAHVVNPPNPQTGDYTEFRCIESGIGTASTWVGIKPLGGTASNQLPTVLITSPLAGAIYSAPASVTITAGATDSDGTIAKVEFFQGTTKLAEFTSSPYSFTWSNVPSGTYTLTARAVDNKNGITTSVPVSINVNGKLTINSVYTLIKSGTYQYPQPFMIDGTPDWNDGNRLTWYNSDNIPTRIVMDLGISTKVGKIRVANYRRDPVSGVFPNRGYGRIDVLGVADTPPAVDASPLMGNVALNIPTNDVNQGAVWTDIQLPNPLPQGRYAVLRINPPDNYTGGDFSLYPVNTWTNLGDSDSGLNQVEAWFSVADTAPTVSITSPTGGTVYNAPATVTINATASDSDGSISKVEFYQGLTLLGADSTSPYSFTWSNVGQGSYTLMAEAYDNQGMASNSSSVNITVNSLPTSGMLLWLKADALSLGNGDPVNSWTDGSGNGRNAASVGGAAPVFTTNVFNGKPAVRFSGNSWLQVSALPMGTYSIIAVFKTTSNSEIVYEHGANTVGNDGCFLYTSTYSTVSVRRGTQTGKDIVCASPSTWAANLGGPVMAIHTFDGTDAGEQLTFNGSAQVLNQNFTGNINNTGVVTTTFNIGARFGGWLALHGDLAEIIVYDHVLNSTDLAQVQNALSSKYALDVPPTVSLTAPAANTNYIAPASVAMTATASDSDGTISKVEFYQGSTLVGTASTSPYSYTWTNVAMGNYSLTAKAYDNNNVATTSSAVNIIVWGTSDIGSVGVAGSASYSGGTFTVSGAGAGVTSTADAFRYVYRQFSGNTTIVARVASATSPSTATRAGVMMRQNLNANSIEASAMYKPTSTYYVYFLRRTSAGGSTSSTTSSTAAAPPYWVKVVRSSNTLSAFMSANGSSWTAVGSGTTVTMTDPIYVGLAVTSGSTSAAKTVTFDNVSITQP